MLDLTIAPTELVVRAAIVFCGLHVLLRLVGKKQIGELSPSDLLVLLVLSETMQNALVAGDNSLIAALISAATLLLLSRIADIFAWRSKRIERLLEGHPRILVRHGHVYADVLAAERITRNELLEALRREGCTSLSRVRFAILENDGAITVGLRASRRA